MTGPAEARTPVGVFTGLTTLDVVHHVSRTPGPNEKVTALAEFLAAGGPAANAAVTFAALGGDATLVTALGQGEVAGLVRADLERHGVRIRDLAPTGGGRPPVSAIAVTAATGERSVIGSDAVAIALDPPEWLAELVAGADVALVDGHYPAVGEAAARWAAEAGTHVVVDAGRWKPVLGAVAEVAGAMICSDDFRWQGAPGDAGATASGALERGTDVVVVTRGARPVLWWAGGTRGDVSVPAVPAVDTLGAGDVFHGAYAHAAGRAVLSGGEPSSPEAVVAQVLAASRIAALRCSVPGPRAWLERLTSQQNGT